MYSLKLDFENVYWPNSFSFNMNVSNSNGYHKNPNPVAILQNKRLHLKASRTAFPLSGYLMARKICNRFEYYGYDRGATSVVLL